MLDGVDKQRSYHHGDLRSALIAASLELIDEGGVQALSLRKAAKKAGVSAAAPYHHFQSRSALLAAIAIEGFELLNERMLCARAEVTTAGEGLSCCGRAYVEFAREHPSHFRVMFRPELADPNEFPELEEVAAPVFELLVRTVTEGQERGEIPPGDTESYVLLAWSIGHGLSSLIIDGPLGAGFDKIEVPTDQLADVVVGALRRLLEGAMMARAHSGE